MKFYSTVARNIIQIILHLHRALNKVT